MDRSISIMGTVTPLYQTTEIYTGLILQLFSFYGSSLLWPQSDTLPPAGQGDPTPQQDVVFVEVVLAQVAIVSENSSALQSYRVVY